MLENRPEEGFVTVADGVRLFFRRLGSGGRTVLIPNGTYLLDDLAPLAAGRSLLAYDLRHRGRSEPVADLGAPRRGVLDDVDDLEAVRRHFAVEPLDVVAHSHVGVAAVVHALHHGVRVGRIVLLSPLEPFPGKPYPPHLDGDDDTRREVLAQLGALQAASEPADPEERCRRFWSVLRRLYVTDPADAARADWGRCELPNERASLRHFHAHVLPSIRALALSASDLARVLVPVLVVHGRRDRSAPYGGAREWAALLPSARLLTVEDGGHAPWIEAPQRVLDAVDTFLAGAWPAGAEKVVAVGG